MERAGKRAEVRGRLTIDDCISRRGAEIAEKRFFVKKKEKDNLTQRRGERREKILLF